MCEHTIKNIKIKVVTTFKSAIIALSKRNDRNCFDSMLYQLKRFFKMKVTVKRSFVASTAVPLIKINFDVYSKQRFEITFTLKDETSKKAIAHNLKKTIANLALVKSEFSESEFLEFVAKAVSTLDNYRNHLFDAEKLINITQLDFLKLILQEIELHRIAQLAKVAK